MAVGGGNTYVNMGVREIQGQKTTVLRQVFWARFLSPSFLHFVHNSRLSCRREVEWAFTTPLLLLELTLLAGMPWVETISLLIVGEAMVATSLFSALNSGGAA